MSKKVLIKESDSSIKSEQKRTYIAKKKMVEAMIQSYGIVARACRVVGVSRVQFYEWMNTDLTFRSEIESVDYKEMKADIAEDMLLNKIEAGDTACILFTMKCLGKSRGYIEKDTEKQQDESLSFEVAYE
jgi:hypothetical protein